MVCVGRLILGGLVRGLSLATAEVATVIVGARRITVLARVAMLSMARVRNCNLRHAVPTCVNKKRAMGFVGLCSLVSLHQNCLESTWSKLGITEYARGLFPLIYLLEAFRSA